MITTKVNANIGASPVSSTTAAEVEKLLRIREPYYAACANMIVDTGGRSAEEAADVIISAWEGR